MAKYTAKGRNSGKRLMIGAAAIGAALIAVAAGVALLLKDEPAPDSSAPVSVSAAPQSTPAPTPAPTEVDLDAAGGYPAAGDEMGRLSIEGTAVDCTLYYGDSTTEFSKGAGLYTGTGIPGEGRTIISGAHTDSYFRDLESVAEGDEVLITTYYGEYRYRVTGTRITTDTDATAYDLDADHENLVLYTCYPFGITEYTEQRYFVYAELVSGPVILDGTAAGE